MVSQHLNDTTSSSPSPRDGDGVDVSFDRLSLSFFKHLLKFAFKWLLAERRQAFMKSLYLLYKFIQEFCHHNASNHQKTFCCCMRTTKSQIATMFRANVESLNNGLYRDISRKVCMALASLRSRARLSGLRRNGYNYLAYIFGHRREKILPVCCM